MDLTEATEVLRAVLGQLSDRALATLHNLFEQLPTDADETLIALLKQYLPDLINAYADNAADYTTVWYGDLAPESDYTPELPPVLIPEERIFGSIEWAIHTAADVTAAAAKLAGSVDRMVYDASRAVVEHNAVKEKVKYARVARAGACRWCRLMATRGAVFTSAANSIKGHDSCHCVAVPVRQGTQFVRPAHYKAWDDEYAAVTEQLAADGEQVTLTTVLAAMRHR